MDRTGHIDDLITMYTAMKNEPGSNKKAINKTISKLEEARLWAKEIQPGKFNGATGKVIGVNEAETICTCPMYPHALNADCPVHGR